MPRYQFEDHPLYLTACAGDTRTTMGLKYCQGNESHPLTLARSPRPPRLDGWMDERSEGAGHECRWEPRAGVLQPGHCVIGARGYGGWAWAAGGLRGDWALRGTGVFVTVWEMRVRFWIDWGARRWVGARGMGGFGKCSGGWNVWFRGDVVMEADMERLSGIVQIQRRQRASEHW